MDIPISSRLVMTVASFVAIVGVLSTACSTTTPPPASTSEVATSVDGSPSGSIVPSTPLAPFAAIPGYELGVAPSGDGQVPPCPTEVAAWQKSIISEGTSLSVSARGPVHLTARATLQDGSVVDQNTFVDASHSEAVLEFAANLPSDIKRLVLTADAGGKGEAGKCAASMILPGGPSINDICKKEPWPQQIPSDVIGLTYDDATTSTRELGCFNVGSAISTTDGHDVGNDTIKTHHPTTIAKSEPVVGTAVAIDTVVNLIVRPVSQ
jgi:hypothetical protein